MIYTRGHKSLPDLLALAGIYGQQCWQITALESIEWKDSTYMNGPIDIIIPWVDGADPRWQAEKRKYMESDAADAQANSAIRYQNWDNLQYLFRGIEKFMPWFHRVFLVTWGHLPPFLDTKNPKLRVVNHRDYIPAEYLPTFNSNTIEMNYHRIPELSENYILFNDDMFPLQPIEATYYFRNDVVCDEAVENIVTTAAFGPVANMARYTQINNMFIINKYFKKREVQRKHWEKWQCDDYGELLERTDSLRYWNDFPGFHDPHMPSAMKKSVLARLWELEQDVLARASHNRFRNHTDVTQYLIRYWQLCTGEFYPRRTLGKLYFVNKENCKKVASDIRLQRYQMVSLNEDCVQEEFETIKDGINAAFQEILPEKSSFER